MISLIFKAVAFCLGGAVMYHQIRELKNANGTRDTKKAMLILNLCGMLSMTTGLFLRWEFVDLQTAINVNSLTMFFLMLQLFIIYYGKK